MEKQKALVYCRVSSPNQQKEGNGLGSQEHRLREYAKGKGCEVEKVFYDSFTGGGDFMDRPAMSALLAYMDKSAHKNFVVIFDDLKRFARDVVFHWKLRQTLASMGATVECPNFRFDGTPEGEFFETIVAAQGELERKQNKRQVLQKMKARLEKGLWPFYPPPGLRHVKSSIHGKLLVADEPRASTIRRALEGFASNRFPDQVDVQRFLQKNHFLGSRPVYLETVKRLLVRPIYAGYIEYPKWEVGRRKGQHEGLISLETYEKIIRKLKGSATSFTRKDVNEQFPLRGFVACFRCGHKLTGSCSKGRSKRFPYYWCAKQGCDQKYKSISKDLIESLFEALLGEIKPKQEVLNLSKAILLDLWNRKNSDFERSKQGFRIETKKVQEEIDNLVQRVTKSTSDEVIKVYEQQIESLEKNKQALEAKGADSNVLKIDFGTALESVLALLGNPLSKWRNGDINDKRLVLKLVFIDPIAYSKEQGFGTANLSIPLRVFEHFTTSKSQDVEMVRVELTSKNFLPQLLQV